MRSLPLLAFLTLTTPVVGQTSYPMIMSVHPVAARVGTTSEHTIESRYDMFGTWQVLVSGEGVTGEPILPKVEEGKEPPELTRMKVRLTIAAEARPGVRELRIATPRGVSTVGQIVVVRDPLVIENEKNNSLETAQPIELPATVCGKIKSNEEVDFFRFTVTEPTSLVFHVRSMRLQDKIHDLQQHVDPILSLRNASGTTVAANDNAFYGDPFLAHHCEPGDYVIEIRDVRYTGNRYWTYAIEVNDRPFVTTVHPLAVRRGASMAVELVGSNLPEPATATLNVPAERGLGGGRFEFDVEGRTTNPATVIVTDVEPHVESAAENDTAETAEVVAVPGGVCGRIAGNSDVDCFAFDAEKGERYSFEVLARRYGSALDPTLRILDATGKRLAENDDLKHGVHTFSDSLVENWAAPADGRYVIEVRDLHLRGGADFVYHVAVTRAEPAFDLFVDVDKSQLAPGTSAPVFVRVARRNGFDAPIQLHVDDLPAGVTAHCGVILPGKATDGCIVLEAAGDAGFAVGKVTIRGTATVDADGGSTELDVIAEPLQEIYQPGGGRGHWPVLHHTVHVGDPGDVTAMTLSTHDVTLEPGESQRIGITIERAEGFDKTVNLDLLVRHLNRVYGDSLPPGVTIDAKNSSLRLNGKATTGHVTLVAAKDAKPCERQQVPVMANVALNFVMKSTCCAKPLFVTVKGE